MAHYFWLENDDEINEWKSKTIGNLYVSTQYFFNNSNLILGQDPDFRDNFKSYISSNINIKPIIRKKSTKHYKGIGITELNKSLRYCVDGASA